MMESDSPSKAFLGVRFVLFGFDPVNANKVRSKLLNGGGVDVGQYSQNCTHVIVDKLVYDDPVCVAARSDNKTLVTALWVDHSFDAGMPMDPTSIMYRPLKDLDGIPGAKRLIICLTGYQRQDRDDIMIMVGLMGAQFSKPLVANKVTHLICYKFEGEKYELAKMLKTIKLVNHCWLEDCLKDWKLLPEANHKRSGYELEMMEAQAKDSEEEAEETTVKHFAGRNVNNSPHNLRIGVPTTCELPKSVGELSTSPKGPVNVDNRTDILLIPGKENTSGQPSSFGSVDVPKLIGCQDTIVSRGATSGELPDPLDRTPDSKKVGNDLTSTSSAERPPHSDPKFSDISSSRKTLRRSSLSMCSGEISGKISDCSPSGGLKFNDDFDKYSFKVEQGKDRFSSGCFQTSLKGTDLVCEEDSSGLLPQKRTVDISYAGLKLQKVSPDAKLCIASPAAGDKAPRLEPTILIDGLRETNIHLQLDNHGLPGDKAPNMNAAQKSGANISTTKSSTFSKKSLTPDVSFNSETVTMETEQDGNVDAETPQTYFQSLRKSVSSSKPDIVDSCMGKPANLVGETGEPQNLQQDVECSLSNKKLEPEKSEGPANLNLIEEGNDSSVAKPRRKKTVAKKSLGARPKLSTFNNQKGPIYPNKFTPQSDAVIHSIGVKETANHENSISFIKADISPPTVNVETANHENSSSFINVNVMKSNNDAENKDESACDETEAPEDKLEDELESPLNEEKSGMVSLTDKADTIIGEKSEMVQHIKNNCNTSMHDDATASEEGPNRVEPERAVWDKSSLVEPTLNGNGVKGKKCPAGRTKVKTDVTKSKKVADGEETQIENNEGTGMEKEKRVLLPSGKTKSCPVPANKSANSIEVEKENKPVIDGVQNISQGKDCVGKSVVKSNVMPRTSNQKARKVSTDSSTSAREIPNGVKTEPAWFILSGHRLQRKEFQQVIRRLKGRLCRDSHQWSYQATHFIAPDPIRRTEKFFSAAASGRWILKTDYLTACSQAGKFLEEEPYEWHQNGLSEDGAINMEAPRKWRLLRKRTGHGALYGMRIVIYGECIAPPLDTLKRVVKAGDGTILATSPPYNRFLNSGVDFAIISPGMPRVDMWVQEFLKHEIPCVLADLLVEYVCKPGYPLEKHVLYSTNAWAEKSIACLQSRAEETAEDSTVSTPVTPPDHGSNDVACQVCGSRDRGEVMLICGNESGSIGCGVGTHIDCCDPPLEDIPEYDWFCHNCSRSRNTTTSPKKKRKGDSLLKSK